MAEIPIVVEILLAESENGVRIYEVQSWGDGSYSTRWEKRVGTKLEEAQGVCELLRFTKNERVASRWIRRCG